MKRNSKDEKQKLRTFGFVTGAVLLLAILTVVLCAMGGVFHFSPGTGGAAEVTATPAQAVGQTQTTPQASVPSPTPKTEPTPTPTAEQWSISAIAGKGGDLEPSGLVKVDDGASLTFSIIPEDGYVLDKLRVDGKSVSAADTYTFTDVGENHSIYAVFRLLPQDTPAVTDIPAAQETSAVTDTPSSPTDIG